MAALRQLFNAIKYPLVTVGRSYNEVAQKYPFQTGVITTVVKTSAADMFAQKVRSISAANVLAVQGIICCRLQHSVVPCPPAGH